MMIPQPREIQPLAGTFSLHGASLVMDASCGAETFGLMKRLRGTIEETTGIVCPITRTEGGAGKEGNLFFTRSAGEAEEYRLAVRPNGVQVTGSGYPGVFRAVQTLTQLLRTEGGRLPCMEIHDFPAFSNRGFLLDVTRGCVPKTETLKKLVDLLASLKVNQLQLYFEHSFAFRNQSEVWAGAGALTSEDVLELDAYCRERCVELIPCMQTFGHLYHALRSLSHRELCELGEDSEPFSWCGRMHHHTLNVSDPRSFAFVKEMLDEFLPLYSSRRFNICCDETFDLGKGKSRSLAEKEGIDELYLDFFLQVYRYVHEKGREVLFWGDIFLKHPSLLQRIPHDAVALNWDYSSHPQESGVCLLAEAGLRQYVCPGTQVWNTLVPDLTAMRANISAMTAYGVKYHAEGVLNTSWGDYGNVNLFSAAFPGMAYGAALSWNPAGAGVPAEEINREISFLMYGDTKGRLTGLMEQLSSCAAVRWGDLVNWLELDAVRKIPWAWEGYRSRVDGWSPELLRKAYRETGLAAEAIYAAGSSVRDTVSFRETAVSAKGTVLMQAAGQLILAEKALPAPEEWIVPPAKLATSLELWLEEYSTVWRLRNRESELFRIQEAVRVVCRRARVFSASYEKRGENG